jgi:L-iditol 2-dehydrogenase
MSNLAAVMTGLDTIELQERPTPEPGPGQAVVRPMAVGVCGSDVTYFKRGRLADFIVTGDIILGHEVAGQVEAVGEGVTGVAPGDRVAIEPGTPCRQCSDCLSGNYHLCRDLVFMATPPHNGCLVQQLAVDARNLFKLPDSMSYEEGALIEPLSVGLWGCHRAGLKPGDRVLVTGAGPVGLLAAEAAQALGASGVTLSDIVPFRLEVAAKHGFATETPDNPLDGEFDVLLECSGAPGVLAASLRRLGNAGRAAVIGIEHAPQVALPLGSLNWNELTIALVNRYNATWPTGIALAADGRVDLKDLVTDVFALGGTADALNNTSTNPRAMKAVIHPQQV